MQKRPIIALCLVLAVIIVAVLFAVWPSGDMPSGVVDPVAERGPEYTTSAGCRECHAEAYDSWHDSFHRTMTQEAGAESVVAPIDDVTISSRGRSYRFYKKGDEFRVRMVDPTWEAQRKLKGLPIDGVRNPPVIDQQIVMTTGSHHHQAYWIKGAGNEFRQVPFVYHIATEQWIPNEDSFLQPGSHERQTQRWNDNCIICHTVAGRPGLELVANANNQRVGRFNSSFVEMGIACEACHGPGGRHAEAHRRTGTKSPGSESTNRDPSIINPARLDSRRSAAVCGQCHSHYFPQDAVPWNEYGYTKSFRPGELLDESRVIVRYRSALKHSADMKTDQELDSIVSAFWKDGTHRVGGREYNGLIESGCYQRGKMSCLSCHSMHDYSEPNDQLSKNLSGNESCLQCHNDFADRLSEHTHHKAGSSGSLCYNCHMPHTTYALFKGIRSHRIDSPNSQTFVKSGRPNACNLCHLDQTLQWTVNNLQRWYSQPSVPVDQDNQKIAASILWMLQGDAAQRAIVVWSAGWKPAKEASNDDWTVPYVAELLVDRYAAIRFMAARTLETSNVQIDSRYNFIGPEYERETERQRFIDAWQDSSRETQPNRNQRLLFDTKGLPIRKEVDRLIRSRSEKQIVIAE
ncbi:MAG: hypothetical protein HON53_05340 [Planctomycetaceae bacterium]|jgi:predicted CXXCH cytochrome family protein|nr:hypothetical protein [Planctomycetaceae bacterium]MBT6156059.1 hypothetical protein [Planctomycetaceae bacterium]MBT6487500.1 hypothetical protein [Planctomycetaceae bacterium]MBT6495873.1 hypothetical protein [Planctomycetaceae bacterium]